MWSWENRGWETICGRSLSVHYRMFSNIPDLCPWDTTSISGPPPLPVVTIKNVSRYWQMSPRGQNHPDLTHWDKVIYIYKRLICRVSPWVWPGDRGLIDHYDMCWPPGGCVKWRKVLAGSQKAPFSPDSRPGRCKISCTRPLLYILKSQHCRIFKVLKVW